MKYARKQEERKEKDMDNPDWVNDQKLPTA